jgi:hypothetical protein
MDAGALAHAAAWAGTTNVRRAMSESSCGALGNICGPDDKENRNGPPLLRNVAEDCDQASGSGDETTQGARFA